MMPVSHDFPGQTIVLRLAGSYTTADVRAGLLAAVTDARAPHTAQGLIFDVRDSQALATRSAADVRAMARFLASHADQFRRRVALVASSDVAFGLMRLGAVALEQQGVEAHVFRDAADASAWLGSA